jgi:hypothetical protein
MNKIYGKKILILAIIFILFLSQPVLADTIEGWDSYPTVAALTGVPNGADLGGGVPAIPSPWTLSTSSPNCWQSIVAPQYPSTGVQPLPNSLQPGFDATTSPPNAFEWNFSPACTSTGSSLTITTTVNTTSTVLFVSWYQVMLTVCVYGTSPCTAPAATTKNQLPANVVKFTMTLDNQLEYSNDTSSMKLCACWTKITNLAGIPVTPGTTHTVSFTMTVAPYSGGTLAFSFAIDTIHFYYSAPVIGGGACSASVSSPCYNYEIINYQNNYWFNISGFVDSQVLINYTTILPSVVGPGIAVNQPCVQGQTSNAFIIGTGEPVPQLASQGTTCVISYLESPDIYIPNINYAYLVTILVGNSYQRTLIPCLDPLHGISASSSCGATTRIIQYLDNPALVQKYIIQINDLSNTFGTAGAKIFIYTGGRLITSGYVDTQGTFPAALVPGQYKVILLSQSGNEYITTLNAGTNPSLIIAIAGTTFTATNTLNALTIGGGLTCDGTGIIATYGDAQGLTTSVTFILENYTYNGVQFIASQTLPMALGAKTLSTTFNVNTNNAIQFLVMANSTRINGLRPTLGPYPITITPSGCNNLPKGFPQMPNFPNTALGLNQILPSPAAWLNLLSLFIIFITAALFGARAASLGTIFVVGETAVFWVAGWIPIQAFYVSLFMLAAISVFIFGKARKKY